MGMAAEKKAARRERNRAAKADRPFQCLRMFRWHVTEEKDTSECGCISIGALGKSKGMGCGSWKENGNQSCLQRPLTELDRLTGLSLTRDEVEAKRDEFYAEDYAKGWLHVHYGPAHERTIVWIIEQYEAALKGGTARMSTAKQFAEWMRYEKDDCDWATKLGELAILELPDVYEDVPFDLAQQSVL